MQLYYFKDPKRNFGDDLNPWLWPQLAATLFDDNPEEIFVGIGTLINHRLPKRPRKHIFGSGCGYGRRPHVDETFVFHAVRGPDSARELGLPLDRAITDPAVLVRTVRPPRTRRPGHRFGFIPTGETIDQFDWEQVCARLGILCISCHGDVDTVLAAMEDCETVLCEAMHGAIVADALRIPWIPVACSENVLAFKWQDWLSTVGFRYEPSRVQALCDQSSRLDPRTRWKNTVKQVLRSSQLWSDRWSLPLSPDSSAADIDRATEQMLKAAQRPPMLSNEATLLRHTERLEQLLKQLHH